LKGQDSLSVLFCASFVCLAYLAVEIPCLAESLFGNEENTVRRLPSEIWHLKSSEAWRRPYCVVLFDEI
jgi:hypothetical protein